MKYPIPFLILFLLISVISLGQDNKEIGLTEFKNDLHRKIYRITTGNYQCLELVLSKAGVPSGSLIHYVWTCNRKGEKGKLVVQKINIPLDTAGELLKGLNENNFETIPNCADVPGCVNGLDGTTTSFNVKTDKADREYSYWEIDTDYCYREKTFQKLYWMCGPCLNTVNSRINLEKQFDKFFLRLPDGSYTFNHIIMKKEENNNRRKTVIIESHSGSLSAVNTKRLKSNSMSKSTLNLLALFITANLFAQSEFKTYSNNLIYNVKTMKKLEHIVDSLNLKYKVCDYNKVFHSKYQTIGHFIKLDTSDVKQAKKDMENNIPFDDFIRKYPNTSIRKNVLVVKYKYKNHTKKDMVKFSEISLKGGYGIEITKENKNNLYSKPSKNTWQFEYNEKSKYSKESVIAFYFPDEFKSVPLDMKYNRQIGYSDCLIDTVATKYKENLKHGWVDLPKNWQDLPEKKKEELLDEMRSTRVIGGCSMDSRPREHAMNIALLSAETTTNWSVFLKSHLDIMNDRFERVTDGSYAYGERKTYIKELEELDINVQDLLMGISLRVENPAENHYYGSVGRLGRAISESDHKEEFKKAILSMIEDPKLDDYNRVLSYYLFLNFNGDLENEKEQKENTALLEKAVQTMPVYLSEKIKLKEE